MSEIVCVGLAATQCLAYLASLGLLRTISRVHPEVKLSWRRLGAWVPVYTVAAKLSENGLLDLLEQQIGPGAPAPQWPGKFNIGKESQDFIERLSRIEEAATPENREEADWWAAYGLDIHRSESKGPGYIEKPVWVLCRGAGGQHLLDKFRIVSGANGADSPLIATRERFKEALFAPWTYAARGKPAPATRWDPADNANHALCATNPQDDEDKPSMPGAVRLAAEALPLLPAVASERGLVSPAALSPHEARESSGSASRFDARTLRRVFVLPVWDGQLGVDSVRSLLVHPAVCSLNGTSRRDRRLLGVRGQLLVEVHLDNKYLGTTPASSWA